MRILLTQISSFAILILSLSLTASAEKKRVVFLGDSITAGYGLDKGDAYPSIIAELAKQKKLEWICVNAGLSGDTTTGGVRRARILAKRPLDVIVIGLGGNDGLRGIQPAVTEKNLLTMIETIQNAQPKASIILAGIDVPANMGEDYKKTFLATFKKVAAETKVTFYPNLITGVAGDPKLNLEDKIHPNKEGQKIIAEKLFMVIESTISAKKKQTP